MGLPFLRVLEKLFAQFNTITVLTVEIFVYGLLQEEFSKSALQLLYLGRHRIAYFPYCRKLFVFLQKCDLDADAILFISNTLSCVQDLNLDENPVPEQNYDCLLRNNNMLKHLSLNFCGIDAVGAHSLAEALEFQVPKFQQLVTIDLCSNHIDCDGAKSLAKALRTNRDLASLTLTNNWIGNEGAMALASVLQKFQLTEQERELRLQRQLEMLLKKKELMDELYVPIDEVNSASNYKTDQKKDSKTSNSKYINKSGCSKIDKMKRSRDTVSTNIEMEISSALIAAEEAAEAMMYPDPYPLLNDSYYEINTFFCPGNFKLAHLSIAYNKLTEDGVKAIYQALEYQRKVLQYDQDMGMVKCNVKGNLVTEDNPYLISINELLSVKIKTEHKDDELSNSQHTS